MENPQRILTSDQAEETTDDELLLLLVYSADELPKEAEKALTALYSRHAGFLEAVCKKYHWEHPTRPARDFVNEAFAIVYQKKPAFQAPSGKFPEVRRRSVRNFLCGICRFRYLKFCEKLDREQMAGTVCLESYANRDLLEAPVTPDGLEDETMTPTPPVRTKIRGYFDSLDEVNRIILTVSAPYIDLKTGRCNMPPRSARALAKMVELELPTIRQRRKRMLDAIAQMLPQNTEMQDRKSRR